MINRMASLAALVALLLLAAGPSACAAPGDRVAAPAGEAARSTQETASADSARALDETAQARGDGAESAGEHEAVAPEESDEGGGEAEPEEPDEDTSSEAGAVAPSGLQVFRAYICKGIEQSEPTEAGKSFIQTSDGVLRLCCFSEIGGAAQPDTVYHVWYWGEREMARVPLEVEGARWRTWSSKRIIDEWRGDWHVRIVDRDGFVLKRLTFSVE
jgi:hypothetical protein